MDNVPEMFAANDGPELGAALSKFAILYAQDSTIEMIESSPRSFIAGMMHGLLLGGTLHEVIGHDWDELDDGVKMSVAAPLVVSSRVVRESDSYRIGSAEGAAKSIEGMAVQYAMMYSQFPTRPEYTRMVDTMRAAHLEDDDAQAA